MESFAEGHFSGALFTVPAASIQLIQLSHGWQGREVSVSLSLQTSPPPGQKTERAAINYKDILFSCGRFATTLVSKENRYGAWKLGALYSCHTKSRPTDPLTADQRERGRRGGLLSACCSIIIPTSSSFLDSKTNRKTLCKKKKKMISMYSLL